MPDSDLQIDTTECSAVEIYRKHGAFIRRVIHFHIADKSQVDDIFQDFFLSLVINPLPADIKCVENYLYRAVRNCIANAVRQTSCYRAHVDRYARQTRPIRKEGHPEDPVINADEAQKMFNLIERRLSKREAVAITQRYMNDSDVHEAATIIGIDKRSVSRYVSSGLQKIHRVLTTSEGSNL